VEVRSSDEFLQSGKVKDAFHELDVVGERIDDFNFKCLERMSAKLAQVNLTMKSSKILSKKKKNEAGPGHTSGILDDLMTEMVLVFSKISLVTFSGAGPGHKKSPRGLGRAMWACYCRTSIGNVVFNAKIGIWATRIV